MLEDLKKNLGMPHEQDVDSRDHGYRSTLGMRDLGSLHRDSSIEDNVPVPCSVSPPQSARRRSPGRPGSSVGRPPVPRYGSGASPGPGRQESFEPRDSSPQQINVLTIDSHFENTNHNSYSREMDISVDDGHGETEGPGTAVTPTSDRSDRPSSRRRREYRRGANSRDTTLSTEQQYIDPNPHSLDADGGTPPSDDPLGPHDRNLRPLDRTETVEADRGGHPGSVSYRYPEDRSGMARLVDRDLDDEEGEVDSYGAFDANDQLLDTLSEYQQKLEKTNFVDEVDEDSEGDTVSELDGTVPVPLPRRRAAAPEEPQSNSPPAPDSPSDSLDVSELEEDEYLE